jgi:hydroxymethylpyrimidine/phosphomethylpyrimidine kinase
VAKTVLTGMRLDQTKRCGLNLRFSAENLTRLEETGMAIDLFDRVKKNKEAGPSDRGAHLELGRSGPVPDIVLDKGGVGREAMIVILGRNPDDVVRKVKDAVTAR